MSNKEILAELNKGMIALNKGISGAKQALSSANISVGQAEAYNKGLNEAWELAKKLWLPSNHGGLTHTEVIKIFKCDYYMVAENYTPQEALAKLEAYEKEQNEIKVGDVVTNGYVTMLVTGIGKATGFIYMIGSRGEILTKQKPENWKKTGKHIDIQSVLQQIGGDLVD